MKIYHTLQELPSHLSHTAIALGTFDGLHVGHQRLIQTVTTAAKASGGSSVVFTFSNHPRSVLFPKHSPQLLMSNAQKTRLLAAMGLDMMVAIPFTETFLKITPDEFVALLVRFFHPSLVVVGHNYGYGYEGRGTSQTLVAAGREQGFAVTVCPLVESEGQTVSSTAIRQLLLAGRAEDATHLLGRPYTLEGLVIDGDKRGRTLGFPTANIALDDAILLPKDGVYAVRLKTAETLYQGVANIGTNPTFQGENRRLEVFLLDFTGDLYKKKVEIQFEAYLRGEITFAGPNDLIRQMNQDVAAARQLFQERLSLLSKTPVVK